MEPISAAVVTSLLVGYGRHLAGIAGGVLDEQIAERLRALWDKVKGRFSGDEQASGALGRLAKQPDNPRRQAAVEDHLDECMQADPAFAAALAELVEQAGPRHFANIKVSDAGAVAIGGDAIVRGGSLAAGRDIHQNNPPTGNPPGT